jgi:anti-sigma factor RsiW
MTLRFLWRGAASRPVDCRRVGAWLQAYLDGEIDDLRSRAVSRHLRDCRRCGMEAETYRELKASLQRGASPVTETESIERLRRFAEQLAAGEIDAHGEVDPLP